MWYPLWRADCPFTNDKYTKFNGKRFQMKNAAIRFNLLILQIRPTAITPFHNTFHTRDSVGDFLLYRFS